MKKIFALLLVLVAIKLSAQGPTFLPPRSSASTTVQDSRWRGLLTVYLPHTHGLTLNGGLDTLGAVFYDDSSRHIWYRDTVLSGGHVFSMLLKTGDAGVGTVTQVNAGFWMVPISITTTGTISADSAAMAAYFPRRKDSTVSFVTPTQMNAQGFLKTISGITAGGDLSGTYPNPTIATNAVSFGKFQQIAAFSFVGNPTASPANAQSSFFGYGLRWNNDSIKVDTSLLKSVFGSATAGINQLTGDGTAGPGAGSQMFTLATVNGNVFGSNTFLKFSVNGKGLVTGAVTVGSSDITGALGYTPIQLSSLTSTLPIIYNNSTGNISMANSGVTPTSYTNANITVDAFGRITAASNGSGGTGGTNSNVGSGYRFAVVNTNNIKSLFCVGCTLDSTTNANALTLTVTGGSGINQLTGDGTAGPGTGSQAFTLATVNGNVGSFGSASSVGQFTVNGKGLLTAASSVSIQITESQVTNLTADLAGKQPTITSSANQVIYNNAGTLGGNNEFTVSLTGTQKLLSLGTATASDTGTVSLGSNTGAGIVTAPATLSLNSASILQLQVLGLTKMSFTSSNIFVNSFSGSPGIVSVNSSTGVMGKVNSTATTLWGTDGSGFTIPVTVSTGLSYAGGVLTATGGSGNTNSNIGSGFRLAVPNTNNIKTLFCVGCTLDSTTNANALTLTVTGGSGITQLTGDGTAGPGSGSQAFTLATVNGNVGSFGTATQVSQFTVNSKGLITAAANVSILITESQVTNLTTDLAAKQGILSNLGAGYRLFSPQAGMKTLTCTGCTLDSATTGQIGITFSGGSGGTPAGPAKSIQILSASTGGFGNVPNLIADSTTATLFADSLSVHKAKMDSARFSHSIYATPDLSYWLGDSYTFGVRPDGTNGIFPNRIGTLMGLSVTNAAASGTGIWQQVATFNSVSIPTAHMTSLFVGLNDFRFAGANANTFNKLINGTNAIQCIQFAKNVVSGSSSGSGVTRFGTWTTRAYNTPTYGGRSSGSYTITQNDSLVYSFTDSSVYIMFMGGVANYGNWTVYIDTVRMTTGSSNNKSDGVSVLGHTDNFIDFPLVFTGLTYGAHTIKVIKNSTTGDTVAVDFVGNMKDISNATPFAVWEQPFLNNTGYATSPNSSNLVIAKTANAVLDSLFYTWWSKWPTYLIPTNTYWNTLNSIASDSIHPNNFGDSMLTKAWVSQLPYNNSGYFKGVFQIGRKRLDADFDGVAQSVAWLKDVTTKPDFLIQQYRSGVLSGTPNYFALFNSNTTAGIGLINQVSGKIGINKAVPVTLLNMVGTNDGIQIENGTTMAGGIGLFSTSTHVWNNRNATTGTVFQAGSASADVEVGPGLIKFWAGTTSTPIQYWTLGSTGHLVGGTSAPNDNNSIWGAAQVLQVYGGVNFDFRLTNRQNTYSVVFAGDGQTVWTDSANVYQYIRQVNKTGARELQEGWTNGTHSFTRGFGWKIDTLNNFFVGNVLQIPNITRKLLDTTNYKPNVVDASGNVFKTDWATFGGGSQTWQQGLTTGSILTTTNTITNTGQIFTWNNGGTGVFKLSGILTDTVNAAYVLFKKKDSSIAEMTFANFAAYLPSDTLNADNGLIISGTGLNHTISLIGSKGNRNVYGTDGSGNASWTDPVSFSGSWTVSASTNVATVSLTQIVCSRNGLMIHVTLSGSVTATLTATASAITVNLPSGLQAAATTSLSGFGEINPTGISIAGAGVSVTSSSTALIQFVSTSTSSVSWVVSFDYYSN